MLGKNKHIKNGLTDFLNYLKGLLSAKERNAFEKDLQKDPFAVEAMEGLESLNPGEVEEDLLKLNARLNKRLGKSNRVLYFRIAATIAIILTVSALYFTLSDRQLEEFMGSPEVSEALIDDKQKEENMIEPGRKGEKRSDSVRQEKSQVLEAVPERKTDTNKSGKKTDTAKKKEGVPESMEKNDVITEEEVIAENVKVNVVPQVEETEIIAAEVQEKAIRVPEKQEPLSQPQQAISRTGAFTKMTASGVPASNEVAGTVLSAEDSLPLPGVTVRIQGTRTGTVTDSEGNFRIRGLKEQNPKLVVDFIGMDSIEVHASTDENIQILMEPSTMVLDEVVLIGSGKEPVDHISGAASEIEDLDNERQNTYRAAYPVEGTENFKDYIEENMTYPDSTIDRAVVVLKFIVTKTGRPSQVIVFRSPSEKFSEEAIRLLNEGPDWMPPQNKGQYIEDGTKIRILFKK